MLNWVSDILQMVMSMTVRPAASVVALCVTVGHRSAERVTSALEMLRLHMFTSFRSNGTQM